MDRRVVRTRQQLRGALTELLKTKSVQDITVCELADKVDISRGTFYLHYKNVFDMLEKIEQEMLEELATTIRDVPIGTREQPFSLVSPCYQFFAQHAELTTVLMGPHGDWGFFRRAGHLIKARSLDDWKILYPELTPKMTDYLFSFIFGGSLHMMEVWMIGGQKETPEQMAEYTRQLVAKGVAAISENALL